MPAKPKNFLTTLSSAKTRTFVLLFVIILIIGIIIAFMNRESSNSDVLAQQKSQTTSVPARITATPGNVVSPQYKEYQTAENAKQAEAALKKQTSAIPTIVGATTDSGINNTEFNPSTSEKNDIDLSARTQFGTGKETDFLGTSFSNSTIDRERERQEAALKKERERIEKIRTDKENALLRQQTLERDQRLAEQERKSYEESIRRIMDQMRQYSGKAYDEWSKYPRQQYVQGQLASKAYKSNYPDAVNKAGSPISLQPGSDASKNTKPLAAKPNPKLVIKAGTILFGVLETSINTDEPGPVLATVVSGRFHGARLLGSIKHEKQQETVTIAFNQMNVPKRVNSFGVSVVAIDPETARTALASNVNHHYLLRYGTLFASAFVAGYGNAIQQQGSTTTVSPLTGATTTSYPPLDNRQIFLSALGQVGTQWASATREYFQTPYTVTVNQGTSVGLLFMADADLSANDNQ